MTGVTQSSEAAEGQGGRPWPAPGTDADWWGNDTPGPPEEPADPDAATATDASAATAPIRPTVPPTRPAARKPQASMPPAPREPPTTAAPTTVGANLHPPPAAASSVAARTVPKIEATTVAEEVNQDTPHGALTVFVPETAPARRMPTHTPSPPRLRAGRPWRPRKDARRPWLALPALVLLAFAAAFFAWVSADPFWIAVGHGERGTATVIAATRNAAGAAQCQASFIADGDAFAVSKVALTGVGDTACTAGNRLPAQMVSAQATRAYTLDGPSLSLRWATGLGLVILCALTILWVTGATRFTGWRRTTSVALSLGGPLLVTAGILFVAF